MKKLLAVVLALLCVFSSVAVGESDAQIFKEYSMSTMDFRNDLAERILALGKIENPTEVHLELAFRYLKQWFEFTNILMLETAVYFNTGMPTLYDTDKIDTYIQNSRKCYAAGVFSISDILDDCVGIVKPSRR